jgi:NADPH2:quinone reductase
MGGSKGELDLGAVLWKHLTITGSTLRPRTPEEKGAIARELEAQVWPLLERHEVAPIVHTTFPLIDASEAHRLLESGEVMGKLVLRVQAQTKS